MIKKLDILILRSFIGPFVVTFFVALFVLVMQFFWLYMDELVGKGLGIALIGQLLFYMSFSLVPLALPLAILLASIMTFGNMGEYFELVAIKSAGISLLRFMRPLFLFMVALSGFAFFFNNNIIPVANLKALSLLYDLRNSKPAVNIRPGQFNNDIDNYAIRVGAKDKDGKTIRDIIIYDYTGGGAPKLVTAKEGQMMPSPDKRYLIFRLRNGWRYEDRNTQRPWQRAAAEPDEFIRMHFDSWDKTFDLSGMMVTRTDEDLFRNAYQMMNVRQLTTELDSFAKSHQRAIARAEKFVARDEAAPLEEAGKKTTQPAEEHNSAPAAPAPASYTYQESFLELVPDSLRATVISAAANRASNISFQLGMVANEVKLYAENINKYRIELHRKFTLSFACVLLFLIGAPLGAIIRKGGIGMPLVVAVVFFLIYHIISKTGEMLAEAGSLPPRVGMWMSTAMLLPIAAILIQQARNDSQIFSKEWYLRRWYALKRFFTQEK